MLVDISWTVLDILVLVLIFKLVWVERTRFGTGSKLKSGKIRSGFYTGKILRLQSPKEIPRALAVATTS